VSPASLGSSANAGRTKNSRLPLVLTVAKNAQQVTIAPVAALLQQRKLAQQALTALPLEPRNYLTATHAQMALLQTL